MGKFAEVIDRVMSKDSQFKLEPCTDYVGTIADNNGTGAARLQLWNGKAYLNSAVSDGTGSQVFNFTTPPTGRVNIDVTAGEVIVTLKPKAPVRIVSGD